MYSGVPSELQEEKVYTSAISSGKKVSLTYLKLLTLGPGQIGKSTFLNRLLDLVNKSNTTSLDSIPQSSTGLAELREVSIKYVNVAGAIKKDSNWELCDLESQFKGLMWLLSEQTNSELSHNIKVSNADTVMSEQSDNISTLTVNIRTAPVQERSSSKPQTTPTDTTTSALKNELSGSELLCTKASPELSGNEHDSQAPRPQPLVKIALSAPIRETIDYYEKLRCDCKKSLSETKWCMLLNIADVGGQPAFLDMLPSITIGPALYLLFSKLVTDSGQALRVKDLTAQQPVRYRSKNEQVPLECDRYTYSLQEVLFGALSSIACFGLSDKHVEKYISKTTDTQGMSSHAVLFGTFADKINEGNNDALIATELKLKEILEKTDFCKKNLVSFPNPEHPEHFNGKVFFRVNNHTKEHKEISLYREIIHHLAQEKFRKYDIPAAWLGLSICLKILANKNKTFKVSFNESLQLGQHFHLNKAMVDVALRFLHKYVGIVMYFPEDDNLKDIVICNPQVVFSSISELTFPIYDSAARKQSYLDKPAEQKRFEKTGIFTPETVLYSHSNKGLLPINELVNLLVHLNIAAEITLPNPQLSVLESCEDDSPHKTGNPPPQKKHKQIREYFLPAVLRTTDTKSFESVGRKFHPEPLYIQFATGYMPMGFSCALIARLISIQVFTLSPDEPVFYKNMLKFRFAGQFNITMISFPMYCAFFVDYHHGTTEFYDQNCCPKIMKVISEASDFVLKSMQKALVTEYSYDFAFKCPLAKHLQANTVSLAKFVFTDESQTLLKQLECHECGTTITNLQPEMMIWFGKVSGYLF